MEKKTTVETPELHTARKLRKGVVVSDKMDKTRVVLVSWNLTHPKYHKVMRRNSRFHAHDEKNEAHTGDRVEIMETRPMSKLKNWRIVRILEKQS